MLSDAVRIVSYADEDMLAEAGRDLAANGTGAIEALLLQMKEHSPYTWQHCLDVRDYGFRLARILRLIEPAAFAMGHSFSLHDIGKLLIGGAIVNKPDKLSPREAELMAQHPLLGHEIIYSHTDLPATFRALAAGDAYGHHEYWNGTGYPDAKKGMEIPITARALLIVDNFDAATKVRPYNLSPVGFKEALRLMELKQGLYDPVLAPVFFDMIKTDLANPNFKLPPGNLGKQKLQAITM